MKKHYNAYEILIYYAAFLLSASPGKQRLSRCIRAKNIPRLSPGDAVKIYFSSSVQSRASRILVHFSYLSASLLSE